MLWGLVGVGVVVHAGLEEKVVEAEETGKTREAALSTLQKE